MSKNGVGLYRLRFDHKFDAGNALVHSRWALAKKKFGFQMQPKLAKEALAAGRNEAATQSGVVSQDQRILDKKIVARRGGSHVRRAFADAIKPTGKMPRQGEQ